MFFQIKQCAALFSKKFIEYALQDAPGGMEIVYQVFTNGKNDCTDR
jgi:hypothetical protein